jgi:hypothetical protein
VPETNNGQAFRARKLAREQGCKLGWSMAVLTLLADGTAISEYSFKWRADVKSYAC